MELITGENDKGRRLDRILRKALPDHPLPLLHRLLRQKKVFVNGKSAKAQALLDSGVTITIPSLSANSSRKDAKTQRTNLRLPEILWQAEGLIAVNKPAGLAVHGPDSLDTMVSSYLADRLPPSLSFKPGPLHRLDKPSSGIVVFSASIEGAHLFSKLMRERKIKKTYLAIVEGNAEKEEIWEDNLARDKERKMSFILQTDSGGSKTAITKIKPIAASGALTLVMAEIITGRTHQIRAQAASRGHPLYGDHKYGSRSVGGFFLHAWKLEFLEFVIEAPLPEVFRKKISSELNAGTFLF
jgi:23S rRNA pseudouridine955/2504/2580 synthase